MPLIYCLPYKAATNTPIAIDPDGDKVVALMRFDNNLIDVKGHTFSAVGSLSYKPDGISGNSLTVTSGHVKSAASTDFSFPGDFTVECYVRQNAFSSKNNTIFSIGPYNNGILLRNSTNDTAYVNGIYTPSGSNPLFAYDGAWHHVAVVRSGTSCRVFVDGMTKLAFSAGGTVNSTGSPIYLGTAAHDTNENMNGEIDEFRVTKGLARYWSNFTPTYQAFGDVA
jgi:hypothetical protein